MNWMDIFSLICSIPHVSGNEAQLREKLCTVASAAGLGVRVDARGNMAVERAAAAGFENAPAVIMQGHMDMVAQMADGVDFDFSTDSITFQQDGDWISTGNRTSLGADNGLAIALAMEILLDKEFKCGPLRAVFTVEEETGLCGAAEIDPALLQGNYLLNLDSEDDGTFIVGCAGSTRITGEMTPEYESPGADAKGVKVTLCGFPGGHSGVDIHKPLGNALKTMAELLAEKWKDLAISTIDGGTVFNALPRKCVIHGAVPADFSPPELSLPEGVSLLVEDTPLPQAVLSGESRRKMVSALADIPHGVLAWSSSFPGLPETSSNLAAVKSEDGKIIIDTSQRSFIFSRQTEAAEKVMAVLEANGFAPSAEGSYGPWEPAENNSLLTAAVKVWEEVNGTKADVTVIHAGVEVADLTAKNPSLLAISAGPLIENPHSPGERFSMASTLRIRKWLRALLEELR